jgi:hypothetical protein
MNRRFAVSWLALGACGSSPEFDEIVKDHRDELPELRDCGEVELEHECRTELDPAEQCLLDAFASCEAAELRMLRHSVEGDPIPSVHFVEPGAECRLVELTDHSADEFKGDYGDTVESNCRGLAAQAYDDVANTCAMLVQEDCTIVDEWF